MAGQLFTLVDFLGDYTPIGGVDSKHLTPVVYRNSVAVPITTADGLGVPLYNAGGGIWAINPGGYMTALVSVQGGGTAPPTSCTLRPYVRARAQLIAALSTLSGLDAFVGEGAAQTLGPTPNFSVFFAVATYGMDLAVLVETMSGGTAPSVSIKIAWV